MEVTKNIFRILDIRNSCRSFFLTRDKVWNKKQCKFSITFVYLMVIKAGQGTERTFVFCQGQINILPIMSHCDLKETLKDKRNANVGAETVKGR